MQCAMMRRRACIRLVGGLCLVLALQACGKLPGWPLSKTPPSTEILIEAEAFDTYGGWILDAQFVDQMGSPYLLAHGLGVPVANAVTRVQIPEAGSYRVWVRVKD